MTIIRRSVGADVSAMLSIVNDAARAYRGVIPPDRWHEPYMSTDELAGEIDDGVDFWVAEENGRVSGVMGIQDRGEVALVRHAYVAPSTQRSGVGTRLLRHVEGLVDKPILIGTWSAASWAIAFYERNGFRVMPTADKDRLLRQYWSIPERQIETSVVLANRRWMLSGPRATSHPDTPVMRAVLIGLADDEIIELEARIRRAQLDADVPALDRLIADTLLFTGPDGQLGTKAQDLAAHRSGAIRFREYEPAELRMLHVGPDVAVTALRARLAVEVGGKLVRGSYRYTRVWAREGGRWRVVGGHVSEVPSHG